MRTGSRPRCVGALLAGGRAPLRSAPPPPRPHRSPRSPHTASSSRIQLHELGFVLRCLHRVADHELAGDRRERQPVQGLGDQAVAVLAVRAAPCARRYPASDRGDRQRQARLELNDAPVLIRVTATSSKSGAGSSRRTTPRGPVRLGAGHLDVEPAGRRRARRPAAAAASRARTARSSRRRRAPATRLTVDRRLAERGGDVRRRVEQRVQLEDRSAPTASGGQVERAVDPLGGDAGDADQLLGGDLASPAPRRAGAAAQRGRNERFSRCIWTQTSSAMRTSAECENAREVQVGEQRAGVVGVALVSRVDRVELDSARRATPRPRSGPGSAPTSGCDSSMITVQAQCGCWSARRAAGRWIGRTWARGLVATAVASNVGSSMSWHIERT